MSIARHHAEWLSLVPVSGPFLSLPVLMEAFNTGLEPHDPDQSRLLRQEYGHWQESFEKRKADPAPHQQWIKFVLTKTLELDERVLAEGQAISQTLQAEIPEHHELLRPNIVVIDPNTQKPRLLVQVYPRSQELTSYVVNSRWKASPDTRMTELLHATGVRLGLVTNGEHWMLVDAPKGETTGYSSWYASLWLEEKITLQAFRSLLSASRFFNVPDDQTLEALFTKSASNQQEVTDQLGYQVRRAVEVLIHSLDRADQDFGRELLAGVREDVLYESALTVMMRLVFLFCAEERELIPSKPFPVYEQNYSVSTISKQLRELADQHGEELLERRYDAWPRLLAAFRAVYGGLQHDDVHIPAYGGSLFNPDRFPFLEGRQRNTTWTENRGPGTGANASRTSDPGPRIPFQEANPLPVNNRTVLHLLEALQLLQIKMPGGGKAEARRLSFRALDIEQIGHVYEGLLDHTAKRASEPFLGLTGTREKEPEIPLAEIEQQAGFGDRGAGTGDEPKASFWKWLKEQTGRSESALKKAYSSRSSDPDPRFSTQLRTACQGDDALWKRVQPFAGLIRPDNFGYPVVIPKGSIFVTAGTDRRSSGTHYTPRSLTEPIVQYTLEPLVYVGPAEGTPKNEWKLKSAKELLELKICDMACGSGAFLVQAARYMAERLLEAWDEAERGAGTGNRGPGGKHNDDSELSGLGGVETGDGLGSRMLPSDQGVSKGRAFRNDQPDSSLGSLDPSQHRRGAREGTHQGVSQSPEHRTGVADGSTDPSSPVPAGGTDRRKGDEPTDADLRKGQPNDLSASAIAREASLTRSSPPGPRTPVPGPRITPEGLPSTGNLSESLVPTDPAERKTYAMRIIAQRCLYGVDINPLAAEMAKLSLWLLTLAKDKPFEFLDHSIRCGDSLVGLHDIAQLRHFSLKPDADDAVLFGGPIEKEVEEAIALRLKLADMPSNTVEDVGRQEKLLNEANEKIARLRCAADLLMAAEFWGESAKDKLEKVRHSAVMSGHYIEKGPTNEFEQAAAKARRGQKMFHWPLEFPEVIVKRSGFDAFVGNPPFMAGRDISSKIGSKYQEWMKALAGSVVGQTDLCAYFLLRADTLFANPGYFGLVTTNTISEGDTGRTGLGHLLGAGRIIYRAQSSFPWPGSASVFISSTYLTNRRFGGHVFLNGSVVHTIDRHLEATDSKALHPYHLTETEGRSFKGVDLGGTGFVLNTQEAEALLQNSVESPVVQGYFNGIDLFSSWSLVPTKFVINFSDMTLLDAEQFPAALRIVVERVKPYRDTVTPKTTRERWWIYARDRGAMRSTIKDMHRVLVRSQVSNTWAFLFVPSTFVFDQRIVVFPFEEYCDFSVMQSTLHFVWADTFSGSLKGDMCYTPTDCFENFPFPCDRTVMELPGTQYEKGVTRLPLHDE